MYGSLKKVANGKCKLTNTIHIYSSIWHEKSVKIHK